MNKSTNEYFVETSVKDPKRVKKRRSEITSVAVKVFSKKGYHATTTKEIADGAGINVATMFQYVSNKQDILYLVCCHIHSLLEKALYEVTLEENDPMKELTKAVTALYKTIDQLSDYVILMYQETVSLDQEARHCFLKRERRLCHYLEKQIQKGVKAGVFNISQQTIPLLADDILVQAQMWAFRRWSLSKKFTLETYTKNRIKLLKILLIKNSN